MQAAGISATIIFAISIWNGKPLSDALKQSLGAGLIVLGKGTLIYTLTMQLSRGGFANVFDGKNIVNGFSKRFNTINNPIFTFSESIAEHINNSVLVNTTIGKSLGLENITGRHIIGGAVTAAVVFGPDIAKALTGRISTKQLIKMLPLASQG